MEVILSPACHFWYHDWYLIGIGLRASSGEYHFDTWLPFSLFYVMDFSQSQSNPTGIGLTTLSLKIPSKTLKKENWSSRNNHRNKNRLMSENVGIICLFYRILVVFQFWSISLQKYSKNMNFCVYYYCALILNDLGSIIWCEISI